MSREQIEEMAEVLRHTCEGECFVNKDGFTDCEICHACNLYNAGYRKQEWISVDERLPDKEGKYLVCTTNGNIGVGNFIDYYGKGTHLCFDCWAVTHWMPLPEAPKMKGGAE